MGTTRAKQYSMLHGSSPDCMLGDKVMCVQLHGDAAFTGQGIVMESLGLSTIVSLFSLEQPHLTRLQAIYLTIPVAVASISS